MSDGETSNTGKPPPRIGSYHLIHPLGAGGMSSVFKAVHVDTGHEVAVKVLPRALAKNTTLLQRFIREAKSAESLEHPTIVSIYDRGVDQGRHYLVLEYVEGGDLHDRVRKQGPLELDEAIRAIRTIATGLQFAASRGLIHRDIKPANLLMTPAGDVKIIDLGLALHAESEDERVTREGTTVGTVDYMSPEQARDSRATSERSDIYSLGCTFYFLLTGSPPFPGGDISDKLSRHSLEPIPDPRKLRPEIPTALALLIRRMMAKRPENRFASYKELIEALDSIRLTSDHGGGQSGEEEPILFAILDEDEDAQNGGASSPPEPLFALIDDEQDEPAELPSGMLVLLDDETPIANKPTSWPQPSSEPELSLSGLAPLDDPRHDTLAARRPTPVPPRAHAEPAGLLAQALIEDDVDESFDASVRLAGSRRYDDPTKKIVLTYSLIGLALIGFIIGVHQLYLASRQAPDLVPQAADEATDLAVESPHAEDVTTQVVATATPAIKIPRNGPRQTASVERKKVQPEPDRDITRAEPWIEPEDPIDPLLPELEFTPENEHRFIPAWARSEIPDRLSGPAMTVRRVGDPKDPTQRHALRLALEMIGGTVEIADNGPFFEDELRIRGDALMIRARPGYRPVISIEAPQLDVVREQPAVFMVEGRHLILDGLELIVSVPKLPPNQTSLFLTRGGQLTLKRCTITIVNPRRRPFSLVRTSSGEQPSRLRMEETFVRGSAFTAVDLASGSADIVFNRSAIVSEDAPIVRASFTGPNVDRSVHLVRSLLCSRGPLLEFEGSGTTPGGGPISLLALGATCAQLASVRPSSLVTSPFSDPKSDDLVRWQGQASMFVGWPNWMGSGGGHSGHVTDLTAARSIWPGLDPDCREESSRWRLTSELDRVNPSELLGVAAECGGTLTRVPSPTPYLFERTVDTFETPVIPTLRTPVRDPVSPPVKPVITQSPVPKTDAGGRLERPAVSPSGERNLRFDLNASPWHGDLGRFLRDQIQTGDHRLRVSIVGHGAFYSTPIRLPEGLSLILEADPTRPPGTPPIIWSAVRNASADALLDVHGGDLELTNLRLTRDGGSRVAHLVRVRGGNLILNRCWLTAPGSTERGGGNLIAFQAPSTQLRLQARGEGPFQESINRPVCWLLNTLLLTGGDAIQADVGRGLIALNNCALGVGRSAFDLRPSKVARSRFEAGLLIQRCTIAAEGRFVNLGPWQGSGPGPDRPWLVASKDSAFLASYDRSGVSTDSILLRVEANSLDRGVLFWQSTNDAFDVMRFTAHADLPVPTPLRPDVHRQWAKLWGEVHIRGSSGPFWAKGSLTSTPSVRLYDRLQAGKVVPADLELDRNFHPGRPRLNLGADLALLGVVPRKRDRR